MQRIISFYETLSAWLTSVNQTYMYQISQHLANVCYIYFIVLFEASQTKEGSHYNQKDELSSYRSSVCVLCWPDHINLCPLRWRHNGRDSVSNHQPYDCLLNRLFRRRWKKTSKLRVTGLCAGNSPGTGEFLAQMASNTESVSIWWRHHADNSSLIMF